MKRTAHEVVLLNDENSDCPSFDTIPLELYEMIVKSLEPFDFYRFSLTSLTNHMQMKIFKRPFNAVFMARCHFCANRSYGHHCWRVSCDRRGPNVLGHLNMYFTEVSSPVIAMEMSEDKESVYINFRILDSLCPFWERKRENEEYDLFSLYSNGELYHVNEEEEYAEHSYAFRSVKFVWSPPPSSSVTIETK